MSRIILSVLCVVTLMTGGCTTPETPQKTIPVDTVNQDKLYQAEQHIQNKEYAKAAKIYKQLATDSTPDQDLYRIQALEMLIKSGNEPGAAAYAASINAQTLLPYQKNKFYLLQAQMALSTGQANKALKNLQSVAPEQLVPVDRIEYHEALAFSYSLTGQTGKSLEERVKLGQLPGTQEQRYNNDSAILNTLGMQSTEDLQVIRTGASVPLTGWIDLSETLNATYDDQDSLKRAIADWQRQYPGHPADTAFLKKYLAEEAIMIVQPDRIAVLLPESGQYTRYAQAIREGIMAAYHSLQNGDYRPDLRFYDTQSLDPAGLYHQAVGEGAQLIIGPLIKDNIRILASTTELSVPVLALNTLSDLTVRNLFQFGLNPADEAGQVALKASLDGHKLALIMIPETNLGNRIAEGFNEEWEQQGNEVVKIQSYPAQGNDYSQPIKSMLNLDESENRYKQIHSLVPSIQFTPRRRRDADVILISGNAKTMRLLNPQLQYYRANDIPVYATPQIYSGRPDPGRDIDLDGIIFCDAPWVFPDLYNGELSVHFLQPVWQQFPSSHFRLVALGIDAFQIIPYLNTMKKTVYQGATGNLRLDAQNRIRRNLACAKFQDGTPVTTGIIEIQENLTEPTSVQPIYP